MSISYKSRRMVSNYPGKEKVGFMATKANGKTIHTDELCRAIADKTTLSTADVKGVIEALVCELESSLEEGNQSHCRKARRTSRQLCYRKKHQLPPFYPN